MGEVEFVSFEGAYDPELPVEEAAQGYYEVMQGRRTVRHFSDRTVSRETIEWLVKTAGSAPSGANLQPWTFVCVQDPGLKGQIRRAAEEEERAFYERRATDEWLEALEPLGTDATKEFLEVAPWLIVVFRKTSLEGGGNVYYSSESVGIAVGMLLAAAHHAGLVTLTHTPSPMGFLGKLLERPGEERPYMLIPVGYPADDCVVPKAALAKKSLDEIMIVDRGRVES